MDDPYDGPFQDFSEWPDPVQSGRNRVELVLQTRKADHVSDLAWEDSVILASHVVGEEPPTLGGIQLLEPIDVTAGPSVLSAAQNKLAKKIIAGTKARIASGVNIGIGGSFDTMPAPSEEIVNMPGGFDLAVNYDPAFWEASASMKPADSRPRRLMLREFERFYSDNVMSTRSGSRRRQRRVIEERLIYADIIPLPDAP